MNVIVTGRDNINNLYIYIIIGINRQLGRYVIMIRLNSRQLHIILGMLIAASLLIGGLFVMGRDESFALRGKISTLANASEGWVVSYETLDEAKWKQLGNPENKEAKWIISEVLNLPNTFKVKSKNEVLLSRRLPDFTADTLYMVFNSRNQKVRVSINRDVIYETGEDELSFPYHVIPIDYRYRNGSMTIRIINENTDEVTFSAVKLGTYSELISDAFSENGGFVIFGGFLIIVSISLAIICVFAAAEIDKKYMLIYSIIESFIAGLLFLVESRLFRIIFRWELLNYYIRACMLIIAAVGHLIVVRCLIKRKKILTAVDIGIIFYCVLFISVLVFQWFGLLSFDKVYIIVLCFLALGIIIYTLLMGSASYDYRQKEGRPVFIANIVLVCAGVIEVVLYFTGASHEVNGKLIITGVLIYFLILWNYGLKRLTLIDDKKDDDEEEKALQVMQERLLEQLNLNLIFASFKSLQKLIKNGSENSARMVYYISVYLMNNVRAMNSRGEITTFENELEHIISYLQLQKLRNSRFSFAIEEKAKDFKVPRNTLEPIVENAVKYGIGGKDNKGNVVIRTYEREDGYAVQIIDDGIGFDVKQLKRQSATALKNLFDMLENKCLAKTEVISKEGKGTVVTIVLPMLDNELM